MSEYDDTNPQDETSPEASIDPLGIIGWVIAGKYKIHSYLGGGGFGEVYEGYNENLPEQRLVIKFFKRVQAREKFAKEAKILCMLDHPNICRVIDYLPDEGAVVVAFIDGKDGSVILKDTGALPEHQFLNVARSITDAIAYAHEKKIAHRDIKPGNIIVDKNENVYLIDFGIAKEMGTEATKTAYTALTPMFAAPERQAGEKGYNPFISDIYETGITLFNLATNSLPYRNPTNPMVSEWGGVAARRLSPELTKILKKATHPVPAKRYTTASEMAEDLKNLKNAYGKPRKRRRLVLWLILLAVLIGAGYLERDYVLDYWAKLIPSDRPTTQPAEPPETESEQQPAAASETGLEGIEPETVPVVEDKAEADVQPQVTAAEKAEIKPVEEEAPLSSQQTTGDNQQQVAADQKPAVKEEPPPKEPEPKPPPPPPKANVMLSVIPDDDVSLTVGGTGRQPGRRFQVDPGQYEVVVIQPDYPIFRHSYELGEGSRDLSIDLAQEFANVDIIELQVALIPPIENHILELIRNGRKKTITNFPFLGLEQSTGEWGIRLNVRPIGPAEGGKARVDSCVIFPFTPELRQSITGNFGILKIKAPDNEEVSVARFLVYWTEE